MIHIGWKLLIMLIGDIISSSICTIILMFYPHPPDYTMIGNFFTFFLYSLPAYFILGIPSSYLADWVEKFYIAKYNKISLFLLNFGIYVLLGGITGFIFGFLLYRDDLFLTSNYFPFLYLGALASLGFFFAQLLVVGIKPKIKK